MFAWWRYLLGPLSLASAAARFVSSTQAASPLRSSRAYSLITASAIYLVMLRRRGHSCFWRMEVGVTERLCRHS